MLNKRKQRLAAPVVVDGTAGVYIPRSSPPQVPSTAPSLIQPSRSLSGSQTSLRPKSSTTSAFSATQGQGNNSFFMRDSSGRRLSHTPIRQMRKAAAAPRKELSSHSFNHPAGHHAIGGEGISRSNSSLLQPPPPPCSSTLSLQSLPTTTGMMVRVNSSSVEPSDSSFLIREEDPSSYEGGGDRSPLPLPYNWEVEMTADGIQYFVDHNNQRTHWIHPLAKENLATGWTKIFDPTHGVVYYNEVERRSQFDHPGLAATSTTSTTTVIRPSESMRSMVDHLQGRQQRMSQPPPQVQQQQQQISMGVEGLNIIDGESVPEWIRLYSEAPFEDDHLLDWTMFDSSDLSVFGEMLMKLFKQDAINTVIKYERPRREINQETAKRIQQSHQ